MSADPASAVRSLGPPPLSGQERAAEACFELVYDRAVGLAGALAAANGLLASQRPEPMVAVAVSEDVESSDDDADDLDDDEDEEDPDDESEDDE